MSEVKAATMQVGGRVEVHLVGSLLSGGNWWDRSQAWCYNTQAVGQDEVEPGEEEKTTGLMTVFWPIGCVWGFCDLSTPGRIQAHSSQCHHSSSGIAQSQREQGMKLLVLR